ncbi:orotate phosphoribosyltransferase [Pelagibacteraceae bacterium]|jgi:orotate phosphoribosyltransferase|nr:orotate phosphoribosyltransferase [Pelagibacteraceae bacterium]
MLTDNETRDLLKETEALMEGHFILSSGLRSEKYVQCAKLLMHPQKAETICRSLADKIKSSKIVFDIVVSPAIGGILAGYEVARHLSVPTFFTERINGKFTFRRGFQLDKYKNVLIVEDVITTGKSSLECAATIQEFGGKIAGYACIIDRSGDKLLIKDKIISQIKLEIPSFSADNMPDRLKNIKPIKPGSREIV